MEPSLVRKKPAAVFVMIVMVVMNPQTKILNNAKLGHSDLVPS